MTRRTATRRGVLAAAGGAGLTWATVSGRDLASGSTRVRAAGAQWSTLARGGDASAVAPARFRTGADGVAEVELVATSLSPDHPLAGLVSAGYADGIAATAPSVPGPTLLMPPGQRVRVRLRNQLAQPTSLHLHGLRIAPAIDAPFASVAPGASRVYDVTVPVTQVGTYWYHPHVHGLVEPQMRSGLTGGMTLDRPLRPAGLEDIASPLLVLTTLTDESQVLVNGHREPVLRLPVSRARLRLVNTSTARTLRLNLLDQGQALTVAQLAVDDGWLERPQLIRTLVLAPGERMEVLLDCPPRDLTLSALDQDSGDIATLATIRSDLQVPPAPLRARMAAVRRFLPGPHIRTRRIVFGVGSAGQFTIDGKTFDHHRNDVQVKRGSTEVWELVNTTEQEHPFHLHSYPFQVLSRNGKAQTLAAWRDVALLRPFERMRIIISFRAYSGRTVLHCHNVAHEDAGMMATLLVR